MHDAKVSDIKIRTFVGNSVEISPIVVSVAEDGSVKIWYEGGRMFDCDGLKFKVSLFNFLTVPTTKQGVDFIKLGARLKA